MARFLTIDNPSGNWWKGDVTLKFHYNLKKVLFGLLAILALALTGFILYWIGVGLWAVLKWIWSGICWLAGYWMWILGIAALALIVWLLTKVKWPERKERERKEVNLKWLWWVLAALLLMLIGFLCFKSCREDKPKEAIEDTIVVTPAQFDESFDWVVTSRAYLDGVQEGTGKARALVGFKFVNGKPVTNQIFEGRTYEEAMKVVAADWRGLIVNQLGDVKLNEQQLVAVTLFAMRNGKYGFTESDFLEKLQDGEIEGAEKFMALHDKEGNKRPLEEEGRQYLWMLQQLYNGNIDMKELVDWPMFSYRALPLNLIYEKNTAVFSEKAMNILKTGSRQTPRQALGL